MDVVRATSEWVACHASHVSINPKGIEKIAKDIGYEVPSVNWDFEGIHYFDGGPLTAQYLLVLDALNFCFWPDSDLQYDHLAAGLATALRKDPTVLNAHALQTYTGPMLRQLIRWPRPLPLEDERARLLNELGTELEERFGGQASNLVAASNHSAVTLVHLVTQHFPGFRDHCVYKGHQIFLYKRAQIFVADLWGAFKGQSLGQFEDIAAITMFADYVVPAVLRHWGVLTFSTTLAKRVDDQQEIASGSEEEVEIRACTITAVERIREHVRAKTQKEILSVHLDWWLWSAGLAETTKSMPPHHRTRTIYY